VVTSRAADLAGGTIGVALLVLVVVSGLAGSGEVVMVGFTCLAPWLLPQVNKG
jgi:hypothetical protein